MDGRTRVQQLLRRQPVDRIPVYDSFWEDTLTLWRQQGLGDANPMDLFEMDFDALYLDLSLRQPQRLVARDDATITVQDRAGYVVRKFAGKSRSMEFVSHCTTDRRAWDTIRPRLTLDPDQSGEARLDDRSYFMHMDPYPTWQEAKAKFDAVRRRQRFVFFCAYGPWEATWRHRGMDHLLMDLALDPQWVRDMIAAHVDLLLETLEYCRQLDALPDGLFLADDFGCTRGLLFSPAMWLDLFQPQYVRMSNYLHQHDVSLWLHSCGDVRDLINPLIEAGLDVLQPLQVAAGMDLLPLLDQYGDRLTLFGNIDAAAMSGPAEPLEAQLRAKITLGRTRGGYMYHSDHSIPPEVTFSRYQQIMRWVREFGGN